LYFDPMNDEPAHAVTLRLLNALAEVLTAERRQAVLSSREQVERLLQVEDEEAARETARDMLRDALSV
jgi:hypothetical protein